MSGRCGTLLCLRGDDAPSLVNVGFRYGPDNNLYKVRNPYIIVMTMTEVIKVTSKGQLTLPVKFRKNLGIDKDSYLLVEEIGEYLLLKKIQQLDHITSLLTAKAKKKGVTKEDILNTLKQIQKEKWSA